MISRRIGSMELYAHKPLTAAFFALLAGGLCLLGTAQAIAAAESGAPAFSTAWAVGTEGLQEASVTESGLQLRSTATSAGPAGPWEIGLSLSGYGQAGDLRAPGVASHSARENHLVVQHDGLEITYTNAPRGIEQVISLSPQQSGRSMEGLVSFDLRVSGNLLPRRDPSGAEVAFTRPDGEIVLLYTIGRGERESGVPARLELLSGSSAGSYRLWIVLDRAGASDGHEVRLLIHRNVELEPNDVSAQANALSCGLEGGSLAAGDVDTFAIGSPVAGSRLFAAVETNRGDASAFRVSLESPGADAVIARDARVEGDDLSAGGGSPVRVLTRLLGGGSAFLRIKGAPMSAAAERYRLYTVVQPSVNSATEETEPNDSPEKATRSSNDYYAAALESPKDVDYFSFTAAVGDLVFIGLDTDRNHDGHRFAGSLDLLDASGSVLAAATGPASLDIGLVYRSVAAGTYVLKVAGKFPLDVPQSTDYALSISRNCQSSSFVPEAGAGGVASMPPVSGPRPVGLGSRPPVTETAPEAYAPDSGDSGEETLFVPPAEINDSVRVMKSGSVATISWTDSPGPYNVYKGSRPAVQAWSYNHSCFSFNLSGTSATDSAVPLPGGLFYYLVTRQSTCEESIAGRDSSGAQIPDLGLCVSPGQGPPPSKPYFMLVVDNSGSMGAAIAGATSCGYQSNRLGHARCAVRNIINAYAGQVNFGLATYAWQETGCVNQPCGTCDTTPPGCFPQCSPQYSPNDNMNCGPLLPEPTLGNLQVHAGAAVPVPLLQDHYWVSPPDPSNLNTLLSLVDNNCGNSEIGANSQTPLGGTLFSMNKYFSGTFNNPFTGALMPTPIGPATFNGQPAERPCRSINIIFITDGDETCDSYNTGQYPNQEGLAVYEAGRLFNTGVTISGQNFRIKTYVIGFVGATTVALNNIAASGGTTSALTTANEVQLTTALGSIVTGALAPEKCDNLDNNCNGCTDEGYRHFADVQPISGNCCTWANAAQRANCINTYLASITPGNPQGNRLLLPCTTLAQATNPATWLCYDPGEMCDNVDNNGEGAVDEGQTKCGSPAHCPIAETCNGQDDNCNGLIDDAGVCPNGCVVTAEICDGCDNDCDGVADNGVGPSPCGQPNPANCTGTRTCKPPVSVPVGGCNPSGGYNACSNSPATEVCDGIDNDCNGAVDDSGVCPCPQRQEVCNGLDDNCNGSTDEGVTPPPVTQVCGVSAGATSPECTSQVAVACIGGAWQCTFPAGVCNGGGGCSGTAEICDSLDNNCDGRINENTPNYGKLCASDDGVPPPGHGLCRTTGTYVCNGPGATTCSAVKANCATLPGGCDELCDGIDNDCDGLVDEAFNNKGTNAAFFVKPAVTKIAAALWIYSEEASRPNATSAFAGIGNGYQTSAPTGSTLDKTKSCSAPNKVPWYNVTGGEAEQICTAAGGHLCTSTEQQTACKTSPPGPTVCTWGYAPNGSSCTTAATGSKFCNLGPTFDFSPSVAGDQDGLLSTASPQLVNCNADWAALLGNGAASGKIFDMTGNLRELAKVTTNQYVLLGGAFNSASEAGSACTFTFNNVNETYQSLDTGFRCCFSADPRQ